AKTGKAVDSIYSKMAQEVKKNAAKQAKKSKEKASKIVLEFCSDVLNVLGVFMVSGSREYSVGKGLEKIAEILDGKEAYFGNLDELIRELNEDLRISARNPIYFQRVLDICAKVWKGVLLNNVLVSRFHSKSLYKSVEGLHETLNEPISDKSLISLVQHIYAMIESSFFNGNYENLIGMQVMAESEECNLENRINPAVGLVGVLEFLVEKHDIPKNYKKSAFETVDLRKLVCDSRTMTFIPAISKEKEHRKIYGAISFLGKNVEKEYDVPFL
ncbi:MAG: hypothetical protein PHH26_02765, partial [Candidatus Thermoplasmatota archaeon]|nr:hypothetical protein [Candidatus Thermoplasmatota archaeon]